MEQLGDESGFPSQQEDTTVEIIAVANLTRVGGESKLIIEGGLPEPPANQPHPGLIEALVMAHIWNKAFTNDPCFTIRAVAKQANLSERYTSGILKLANLAPDITRAILRGAQPRSLSLKKLLEDIPLSWEMQRSRFGFVNPALG